MGDLQWIDLLRWPCGLGCILVLLYDSFCVEMVGMDFPSYKRMYVCLMLFVHFVFLTVLKYMFW